MGADQLRRAISETNWMIVAKNAGSSWQQFG
jgi:hypothetical protein